MSAIEFIPQGLFLLSISCLGGKILPLRLRPHADLGNGLGSKLGMELVALLLLFLSVFLVIIVATFYFEIDLLFWL
jgi:hypothetical protein